MFFVLLLLLFSNESNAQSKDERNYTYGISSNTLNTDVYAYISQTCYKKSDILRKEKVNTSLLIHDIELFTKEMSQVQDHYVKWKTISIQENVKSFIKSMPIELKSIEAKVTFNVDNFKPYIGIHEGYGQYSWFFCDDELPNLLYNLQKELKEVRNEQDKQKRTKEKLERLFN